MNVLMNVKPGRCSDEKKTKDNTELAVTSKDAIQLKMVLLKERKD